MNTYLDALLVSEVPAHGRLHLLACLLQLPLQPLHFLPSGRQPALAAASRSACIRRFTFPIHIKKC